MLRPTLEDYVIEMPRGAQVIYPKDLAPICMLADIGPGAARVRVRRRLGRAVDDDAARPAPRSSATRSARTSPTAPEPTSAEFLGAEALERYTVELRDSYEGIDTPAEPFDRVVLDLPEPWQVVPHARATSCCRGRRPGGLHAVDHAGRRRCREELERGPWIDARTIEVLHRGWHIEGQAVRPDHRMVAHTGFLTAARFLGT